MIMSLHVNSLDTKQPLPIFVGDVDFPWFFLQILLITILK